MEKGTLALHVRAVKGKNAVKKLLKDGLVPAVIYGHNKETVQAMVDRQAMKTIAKNSGKAVFYTLEHGDEALNGKKILVKEIAKHPVEDTVLHIDFYEMSDQEMLKIPVPIKLKGKPVGVTNGAILEWERREVLLKAFPEAIPNFIEVDVSQLAIGHSIHLADISLPKDVHLAEDGHISLVILLPPKVEVELTPEEKEAQLKASLAEKEKEGEKEKEKTK